MSASRRPARRSSKPKDSTPSPAPPPAAALGRTGRPHPPIGIGLWALGRWHTEDEEHTRQVLDRALERELGWIDTAEVYGAGRSERLLGDALGRLGADRRRPMISTKLSWEHLRASQVRPSLIGSLHRLALPSVDLYLVHAPDPKVPLRETMAALEPLWKEGRVGALGVSNFSVAELEEAARGLRETTIAVNQVPFNLFEREEADAVLPYCREHGIVVEAYSPTSQGLLAGRFLKGKPPGAVGRARRGVFEAEMFPDYQRRAQQLAALAAEGQVPMLSLALHAIARAGAVPLFGASRPEQVDDTLAAWAVRPADDLLDRAEALARTPSP